MKKKAPPEQLIANDNVPQRMRKKATPRKAKGLDPVPSANPAKLIRTVRGTDERGFLYQEDIFEGHTMRTYGIPHDPDERGESRLVRRQKGKQKPRWSFYSNSDAVLKGEAARTHLQRLWSDPFAMSVLRSAEAVWNDPLRIGGWWSCSTSKVEAADTSATDDGEILKMAMFRAIHGGEADKRLVRAAIDIGKKGLLSPDDAKMRTRTERISFAVVQAAAEHDRPPTAREVFCRFVASEKLAGRAVYREQGAMADDSWEAVGAQNNFRRDMRGAGWSWLIR